MNRIEFHRESGKTVVELHDVQKLMENELDGVFSVKEKPVYLQIFFHRPLEADELRSLYENLIVYDLIKGLDESNNMERAIKEDLEHQDHTLGMWEIKCEKFQDAFECCYETLARSFLVEDGAFSFQLSDEPSERFRKYAEIRREGIERVKADLIKLVEGQKYVDVGGGAELMWGCSRKRFNTALNELKKEGYFVTVFGVPQKMRAKLLTDHQLDQEEVLNLVRMYSSFVKDLPAEKEWKIYENEHEEHTP